MNNIYKLSKRAFYAAQGPDKYQRDQTRSLSGLTQMGYSAETWVLYRKTLYRTRPLRLQRIPLAEWRGCWHQIFHPPTNHETWFSFGRMQHPT